MLRTMLERAAQRDAGSPTHNEFVLDAEYSEAHLPASVEAFFFPETDECDYNLGCRTRVQQVHKAFLRQYGLDSDSVPLLAMRLDNLESPFTVFIPGAKQVTTEIIG